jgi:hypothetical protein
MTGTLPARSAFDRKDAYQGTERAPARKTSPEGSRRNSGKLLQITKKHGNYTMIDKLAFRRLTPAHLGWADVRLEPDSGRDFPGVDLTGKRGTGAVYRQGHRTGTQLVQLEAGVTMPEVASKLKNLRGAASLDPAEESRMLARVLTLLLGLPLQPGSPLGDVIAAIEPLSPRILWTKSQPVEGDGVPDGTRDRRLMALRDGLMVEAFLRQDRLYAIAITDLELMILNDVMPDVGKARKADVLQENLAGLASDPVPFALKWSVPTEPDCVEWSRGIEIPVAAPQPQAEVEAETEEYESVLPQGLAGPGVVDLELEENAEAVEATDMRHRHEELARRYGSLRGLLEQAPDAELLLACATRCSGPESSKNAYPRLPGLGRAASVLHVLYDDIVNCGGLEGWFVTSLDEVPDALSALHMTGTVELEQFLIAFASRAGEEGCDIESEESWEEYFARDSREADEAEALRLAPAIIPCFRAWALASPEVTADAHPLSRGKPAASVTLTRGGFVGALEGMLQKASRGMLGRAAQGLLKRAGRLRAAPARIRTRMEAAADHSPAAEQKRMREKYASLSDAVLKAPVKDILNHVAAWSGCSSTADLEHCDNRTVRMAVCLHALEVAAHAGIDDWFRETWPDYGTETMDYLRDVGAVGLAEHLTRTGEQWTPDVSVPLPEQLRTFLTALPHYYRKYWSRHGVEAAASH